MYEFLVARRLAAKAAAAARGPPLAAPLRFVLTASETFLLGAASKARSGPPAGSVCADPLSLLRLRAHRACGAATPSYPCYPCFPQLAATLVTYPMLTIKSRQQLSASGAESGAQSADSARLGVLASLVAEVRARTPCLRGCPSACGGSPSGQALRCPRRHRRPSPPPHRESHSAAQRLLHPPC